MCVLCPVSFLPRHACTAHSKLGLVWYLLSSSVCRLSYFFYGISHLFSHSSPIDIFEVWHTYLYSSSLKHWRGGHAPQIEIANSQKTTQGW